MLLKLKTPVEEMGKEDIKKMENGFREFGKEFDMDCFNHFKLNRIETYVEVENDKISVEDLNKLVGAGLVEVVSL